MKYFFLPFFILALLFVNNAEAALEGEEQIYADLLTRNNSAHIKVAAQSIYNKNIDSIELTDIVAEVLLQSLNGSISLKEDTQAWLAKTLGGSQKLRYEKVLKSIIASNVSRKVKKYSKEALNKLSIKSDKLYMKGDISLNEEASKIAKQKQTYKYQATEDKFNTVYTGDSIKQVIVKLGMPDTVNIVFAQRKQRWVGYVSYSLLKLKYKDFGSFNFEYYSSPIDDWNVIKVISKKGFSGELTNHSMMDPDPKVMRAYIRNIIKQVSATELDRDLASERLYRDLNDDNFVDTLSWACRLLGLSGNSRYRSVLENTIEKASTRKLRRYAEKALNQISTGNDKQYLAGDVYKEHANKSQSE